MTRTSLKNMNCSLAQFAEILGDKWSLLILRDAFIGVKTFSEFQKRLQIAKNVLTERLNHLVENGILVKQQSRPGVERYVYELTPMGRALFPVGTAIMQWGDKWIFGSEGEPVLLLDKENKAPVQSVEVIARDGRMLSLEDAIYVPGAGSVRGTFIDRD